MTETTTGDGWAVGSIDAMGDGPGFRKVRRELDVKAFGVNAVVMPPGYASGPHYHERQEELYLVHRGEIEFTFGDEDAVILGPGGLARVDAATVRRQQGRLLPPAAQHRRSRLRSQRKMIRTRRGQLQMPMRW